MSSAEKTPWRRERDGVLLRVRLTPRSSRDAVEGVMETADGPALAVRVRAVPEDGAANAALEVVIAKWLGCTRSGLALIAGHNSRVKTVAIAGHAGELETRLSALVRQRAATRTKGKRG
ncbi:MAG: DUF167 family protein [Hyphomicrobiaceae bacterium]